VQLHLVSDASFATAACVTLSTRDCLPGSSAPRKQHIRRICTQPWIMCWPPHGLQRTAAAVNSTTGAVWAADSALHAAALQEAVSSPQALKLHAARGRLLLALRYQLWRLEALQHKPSWEGGAAAPCAEPGGSCRAAAGEAKDVNGDAANCAAAHEAQAGANAGAEAAAAVPDEAAPQEEAAAERLHERVVSLRSYISLAATDASLPDESLLENARLLLWVRASYWLGCLRETSARDHLGPHIWPMVPSPPCMVQPEPCRESGWNMPSRTYVEQIHCITALCQLPSPETAAGIICCY
jgi:hypothetical protein